MERWKDLGASKLYRVARLSPEHRNTLLKDARVREMNGLQFSRLLAPLVERRRRVTGNMRGHGLRMKVQAFTKKLAAARVPKIADPALREGLRADLEAVLKAGREQLDRLD
ncbi:MAG: hypothetical protein EXR72_25135 [Myxococcales bacterium]|nr:hypothetical protein [Myxococcales bacterium]